VVHDLQASFRVPNLGILKILLLPLRKLISLGVTKRKFSLDSFAFRAYTVFGESSIGSSLFAAVYNGM